jgi:radical SAM superfamily enzyme YgiQ (UPF0313 family)
MINSNISFIVPSWHYYSDPLKHQPYWELYYATLLKKRGYKVDIYDLRKNKKNTLEETVKFIPEKKFYFFWIFKTGDAQEIYSIVSLLKKKYKNSICVAGGTHVDMCQDECKNFFDSIIIGAGEESFAQVINDYELNNLKKEYLTDYKLKPFALTDFPDRSFLPREDVVNNKIFSQYGEIPATLVYFSRGCIFKCAYCTYNVPRLLQYKDSKVIKLEIKYLKDNYQIKGILVKDEVAISPNKKISESVLNSIQDSQVLWRGQTISLATRDQLKHAKDSGCLELAVGVETVDENVMKIIDKTWQNEKIIREFVTNCKLEGIKVKVCLILGLPGEPKNIAKKTIDFLKDVRPDFVSISGFLPVPGSPIAKDPKKYGIKKIDLNWNNYGHLLHRFSDEEEVGLPFEYEKESVFGKTFTREEIKANLIEVQDWCRSNSMIY